MSDDQQDSVPDYDVVVIGAGPAGLGAGMTAAGLGLKVTVLDEQPKPGGQIYRAIEANAAGNGDVMELLGADYRAGFDLVCRFRASSVEYRAGESVFDISPDGGIGIVGAAGASWIQARRIIIATGAMERPAPVPGWTLPGVMGAGAAQTLLKSAAMVPSERTVIAGSGPLLYLVARQLLHAGANIAAVLETTPRANYLKAAPLLPRALLSGGEIAKGIAWRNQVKHSGVAFHADVNGLRVEGAGHAEAITFTAKGRQRRIACDLVLLHEGVIPNIQLSMAIGAEHAFNPLQACWLPKLDPYGRTSVDAVLVAGDGGDVRGADLAVEAISQA